MNKKWKHIVFLFFGLLLLNWLNQGFYQRFDLTQDQRYTLSDVTKNILDSIDGSMSITVYLEGEFPAEFKRLQIETLQFLEELKSENSKIRIQFIDPEGDEERLVKAGMYPSQLTSRQGGKLSNVIIFPWAEIFYGKKRTIVHLLPEGILQSQEEQLETAIESLEYSFSDGINKVIKKRDQKIAVLKGNGELDDKFLVSLLTEVSEKHKLAPITLDSVDKSPEAAIKVLSNFDMAIVAKPTEAFTEREKLVIDQFIMNGGKSLWMLENTQADTDSLYNDGKMLAYPRDLNLTDLLFAYGVRINTQLIQDLYAAKIRLATGNVGNQPQFQNLPWFYHPVVSGNPQHPITKNIPPVRFRFANQIDTLENNIKKTPLLVS